MINLKLAEYNLETGKFERFHTKVLFGNNFVMLNPDIQGEFDKIGGFREAFGNVFDLDKKDPLNRFDGLFDGRTYGKGRFVLIKGSCDEFVEYSKRFYSGRGRGYIQLIGYHKDLCWIDVSESFDSTGKKIGNIHENPDLFEKAK